MEHWNRLSPQHPCLSFFFVLFLFFSGSASVSLLACLWLFCGILTMPGECYPAFHMSLAVLCVLVCWGIMQWEIIFSCVATNRNVDLMLHWDCLRSSALCTVYTPAVPSSSFYACLSVTMQGRLLSWAHTHSLSLSLYYIMRTFRILCQNYIIALGP